MRLVIRVQARGSHRSILVLYIFSTLKIARVLVYTRTCRLAHTAHAYDSNPVFFSLTQNSGFFCIPWVSGYHDEGMFVWSSLCTFKNHDFWSTCTHVHARKLLMIINVTYIDARCSTPSHACYWPALSGTVVCIGAVCSFLTYFQTCVCWRHACVCTCMYVVGISAHTFVMMMQVCRPLFLLLHFVCTCLILNFVCMWSQRIVHAAEHEVYWPSVCCFTGLQMCLRTPSSTRTTSWTNIRNDAVWERYLSRARAQDHSQETLEERSARICAEWHFLQSARTTPTGFVSANRRGQRIQVSGCST
jgi:hypothetical protein